MFFKTIVQGRLEFGTKKVYDKVIKMFQYRAEHYHKNEIIFQEEDIFNESELCIFIPRFVGQSSQKHFKNTTRLIEYCGQFAVTGSIKAWLIDQGKILHYSLTEPDSDKIVVQSYLKGKSLVKVEGKEDEAIEALNKAIEKYDRHAQAYERRGKVNYIMKRYHDAIRDYNKSIALDPTNPHPYFGRAKVHLSEKRYQEAIEDFDNALKTSVALQGLYWKARRLKAKAHIELEQWTKAAFDLKLFTNKKFKEGDSNLVWRKAAYADYINVLIMKEDYLDAIKAADAALDIQDDEIGIKDSMLIRYRGVAKKNASKSGFKKDFKDAAEMGDEEAKILLEKAKK